MVTAKSTSIPLKVTSMQKAKPLPSLGQVSLDSFDVAK